MPDWRPMAEFDPTKPDQLVHDELNDTTIDWEPRWASTYRYEPWSTVSPHLVEWDGLLLDGWMDRPSGAQRQRRQ